MVDKPSSLDPGDAEKGDCKDIDPPFPRCSPAVPPVTRISNYHAHCAGRVSAFVFVRTCRVPPHTHTFTGASDVSLTRSCFPCGRPSSLAEARLISLFLPRGRGERERGKATSTPREPVSAAVWRFFWVQSGWNRKNFVWALRPGPIFDGAVLPNHQITLFSAASLATVPLRWG